MEFVDNTGHIFSLPSYNKLPIGYEYEEHSYIFWLNNNRTEKLSINNYYSKPIYALYELHDNISSEELENNISPILDINIYFKDSNIFKLISSQKLQENISNDSFSLTDYVDLNKFENGNETECFIKSSLSNDDLFCVRTDEYINDNTSINYLMIPIYPIAIAKEAGTWISNLMIHVHNNINNIDEWCYISVGGEFVAEYEELIINRKNLGINLPKDILKSVYSESLYNDEFNEALYNIKLKEYLMNYMNIKGNQGNFKSAIDSLKWFGYGDKISISKLLKTDNEFKRQYIKDYFNLSNDVLISFKKFITTSLISLMIYINKETDEVYNFDLKNDNFSKNYTIIKKHFYGENKPKMLSLIDNYQKIKIGNHDLPIEDDVEKYWYWKPYFNFSFNELGIKLICLANFYKKYFLPIHLYINSASLGYKVYANDIKLTTNIGYVKTEPILLLNNKNDVQFKEDNIYYFTKQIHYVDENFNEFELVTSNVEIDNRNWYYINDTCINIPIAFKNDGYYNCVLILQKSSNNEVIYESHFSFYQSKIYKYKNFIIYPKKLNVNIKDNKVKTNYFEYWFNNDFTIKLLVNNKWYEYDFKLKIHNPTIDFGTLRYRYYFNDHNYAFNKILNITNSNIHNLVLCDSKNTLFMNNHFIDDKNDLFKYPEYHNLHISNCPDNYMYFILNYNAFKGNSYYINWNKNVLCDTNIFKIKLDSLTYTDIDETNEYTLEINDTLYLEEYNAFYKIKNIYDANTNNPYIVIEYINGNLVDLDTYENNNNMYFKILYKTNIDNNFKITKILDNSIYINYNLNLNEQYFIDDFIKYNSIVSFLDTDKLEENNVIAFIIPKEWKSPLLIKNDLKEINNYIYNRFKLNPDISWVETYNIYDCDFVYQMFKHNYDLISPFKQIRGLDHKNKKVIFNSYMYNKELVNMNDINFDINIYKILEYHLEHNLLYIDGTLINNEFYQFITYCDKFNKDHKIYIHKDLIGNDISFKINYLKNNEDIYICAYKKDNILLYKTLNNNNEEVYIILSEDKDESEIINLLYDITTNSYYVIDENENKTFYEIYDQLYSNIDYINSKYNTLVNLPNNLKYQNSIHIFGIYEKHTSEQNILMFYNDMNMYIDNIRFIHNKTLNINDDEQLKIYLSGEPNTNIDTRYPDTYGLYWTQPLEDNAENKNNYLTFEILESNTKIGVNKYGLKYSNDNGVTWNNVNIKPNASSPYFYTPPFDKDSKILIKGELNINNSSQNESLDNSICKFKVISNNNNAQYNLSGNILSLIFGDNYISKTNISSNNNIKTFENMFSNSLLIDASNLILPLTTLYTKCYSKMFSNCANLINAPELPATALADYCYQSMFYNCTSLEKSPKLPALDLCEGCYKQMFYGCTNLINIKALFTSVEQYSLDEWTRNAGLNSLNNKINNGEDTSNYATFEINYSAPWNTENNEIIPRNTINGVDYMWNCIDYVEVEVTNKKILAIEEINNIQNTLGFYVKRDYDEYYSPNILVKKNIWELSNLYEFDNKEFSYYYDPEYTYIGSMIYKSLEDFKNNVYIEKHLNEEYKDIDIKVKELNNEHIYYFTDSEIYDLDNIKDAKYIDNILHYELYLLDENNEYIDYTLNILNNLDYNRIEIKFYYKKPHIVRNRFYMINDYLKYLNDNNINYKYNIEKDNNKYYLNIINDEFNYHIELIEYTFKYMYLDNKYNHLISNDNPAMYWYNADINNLESLPTYLNEIERYVYKNDEPISIDKIKNDLDNYIELLKFDKYVKDEKYARYHYKRFLSKDLTGLNGNYKMYLKSNIDNDIIKMVIEVIDANGNIIKYKDLNNIITFNGDEQKITLYFEINKQTDIEYIKYDKSKPSENKYFIPKVVKINENITRLKYEPDKSSSKDNYIKIKYLNKEYIYGDNNSEYVYNLYNKFFNLKFNMYDIYFENKTENVLLVSSIYDYNENLKLNTYLNYDFYLMHDDKYWYSIYISQETCNNARNINDLKINELDKTKYCEDFIFKYEKSSEEYLINRLEFNSSNGYNQFNTDDIIACYIHNNDRLPFNSNISSKWEINPMSIGMSYNNSFNSNGEMTILSLPMNDSIYEPGYYKVSVKYSLDRDIQHQFKNISTIKIS